MSKENLTSVEGFKQRISGVEKPRNFDELTKLVRKANKEKLTLYPVSSGKNWGYGTNLPVTDNNIIVDLSSLNKICEINFEKEYAVIEPGVTQQDLYSQLKGTDYYFDVTGSSSKTSIVGNILERGIGYQFQRNHLVNAFEVILGSGELLRTGFWNAQSNDVGHLYAHGIGPGLHELFYQSNYGIVTKASIKILKKPEAELSFSMGISSKNRNEAVESIKRLKKSGVICGITHMASKERFRSTVAPLLYRSLQEKSAENSFSRILDGEISSDWYIVGKIQGRRSLVKAAVSEVKKEFKSYAKVYFLDKGEKLLKNKFVSWFLGRDTVSLLEASKGLRGLSFGIPSDEGVVGAVWDRLKPSSYNSQLESAEKGWIFYTALAPLNTESARLYVEVSSEVAREFGFSEAMTLNFLDDRILEAVISIQFDKNNQTKKAHECINKMSLRFKELGILPYRINIEQMSQFVDPSNVFWQSVKKIKEAFDPNGVIAPNRYNY